MQDQAEYQPPYVSPYVFNWFAWVGRRMLAKQFHKVRVLVVGRPPVLEGPFCVYLNHASWWDPLVVLLLAQRFYSNHVHYGPFESRALSRYRIWEKVGGFGVDLDSPAGAKRFLKMSEAILKMRNGALWVTAQGRFADVRERPLALKRGVHALMLRHPDVIFLPLAVEYVFWEESRPELLLAFGKPHKGCATIGHSGNDLASSGLKGDVLESGRAAFDAPSTEFASLEKDQLLRRRPLAAWEGELAKTMDRLAEASCSRRPENFETLLLGASGVGGWYDRIGSVRARLFGRTYRREHSDK